MRNMNYRLVLTLAVAGLLAGGCATPPPIPKVPATAKALMPEPREKGWLTRHEKFNQQAAGGGFDVLFVGDSITQGWEGAGKDVWAKEIAPLKAANFGISGDRTEHVLWRFEHGNLEGKLNPKVMVLMLGTNNTGHRKDKPEEIAAGDGAILKMFHARFPDAKILLLGIFPRGADSTDALRMNNDAANRILATYDGCWNIKYLDIGRKFLEPDGALSKEIMPDRLHLSPKGYQIWADAVVPEIKAALAK